jgi:hypothetical protein
MVKNFSFSKIYKIVPNCEYEDGDIYIGSTTKEYLSQRMVAHRSSFKSWKLGKSGNVSVYDIFVKYGVENCSLELIEKEIIFDVYLVSIKIYLVELIKNIMQIIDQLLKKK